VKSNKEERTPTNTDSDWQPAAPSQRYRNIDIVRGLALFGVLMVNLWAAFRVPLLENILRPYAGAGSVNHFVDLLIAGALEFKAFTIFSFLFGAGVGIQIDRATVRNTGARSFLIRRFLWLLVLGTVHLFLIWNGDILTLYAICGLSLVPFVALPWQALTLIGAALVALPEFVSFGLTLPSGAAAIADIAQARQVYGTGGFLPILKFRWYEAWSLIVPLLISVLSRTAGLMYWGMAAWRSGLLRAPERHRRKLVMALVLGMAVGAPVTINEISKKSTGKALWPALHAPHIDASILLALAYVSGLLLWLTPRRALHFPRLAATGRMALTNYLVQSVVLGFVFFGYGFGLLGRTGSAAAAGIGVALYVAQLQLSLLWLNQFRFGPFEWLWRSLAYGKRQPMHRREEEHGI
jgi:uncharacterized protein